MENQKKAGYLRFLGKVFLATGFILSLYGLTQSIPAITRISLVAFLIGISSLGASLYYHFKGGFHE